MVLPLEFTQEKFAMLLDTYKTFEPANYLQEYYSHIDLENRSLLKFFAKAYQGIPTDATLLEFSGGPSIYSLISAAQQVKEIHFSDFLSRNLEEVELWKRFQHRNFLWKSFFREALGFESADCVTSEQIEQREQLLREKITKFILCDAFEDYPLGRRYQGYYDVVAANFVAESITPSLRTWENIVQNICSILKPSGTLIMTAIQEAEFYYVNGRRYPAVPVSADDVARVLSRLGFHPENICLESIPAEVTNERDEDYKGYKGMLFIKANR
ncbi:MAG: guanitoxin biosynthesis pre-guanitoxin forming N-methyltransferase GntF [Cyanobacteria bacterium P01_G01_bin.38]